MITFKEIHDLTDDLISLSTNKAYGRCSGGWTIILPYRQWVVDGEVFTSIDTFPPDSVVTIEVDPGDGSGFKPLMLGMVDRVAMQWQASPVPHRQVTLSGRDFGKILEKHHIGMVPTASEQQVPNTEDGKESWVSYVRQIYLQAGSAYSLCTELFGWLKQDLDYLRERVRFEATTTDTQQCLTPHIAGMMDESLWDAMKKLAHEPFNMLTTDTDPQNVQKFVVTLEDQPIDFYGKIDRTDANRIHQIEEQEIISHDLGVSDAERVNILTYKTPVSIYLEAGGGALVSVASKDLTSVSSEEDNLPELHGHCFRTEQDQFTDPLDITATTGGATRFTAYQECAKKLWNWRKDNHKLLSGTMQIHIRPDIRAGHCIIAKNYGTDTYNEYLVEQVSHQCTWHPVPQFVTTLHLTRGQKATPLKEEQAKA